MHNFIKLSISIFIISILLGCSPKIKIDTIDKSYETPTAVVDAKIPQLHGLSSLDLQNSINSEFIKTSDELLETFDKEKQLQEFQKINANTAGNCGEMIHRFLMGNRV